ncbi:MAG TPA: hypothetical protein VG944_00760 [Fimbriimonas sp.]|nr:hypothetical protein [Fimbriimonas sp.]
MFLGFNTPVTVQREAAHLLVDNGQVRLSLDLSSGLYDVTWPGHASAKRLWSEARTSDGVLCRSTDGPHSIDKVKTIHDRFGSGIEVTVADKGLKRHYWIYRGSAEVLVRLDLISPQPVSSSYLAPIVSSSPVDFKGGEPQQSLFVPYDNDMYVRYSSDSWNQDSYEVGAVYDNRSRHGLIVGSLDHDVWKSAVRFDKGAGFQAHTGATGKWTHDTQPHGLFTGRVVSSPRMSIGWYDDWRKGLERFGALNALVRPPLPAPGPVPFGWSSWSGYKDKIRASDAKAAVDFFRKELPSFRSGGTAYMNLDSFWDNLKPDERKEFVSHCHAAGLKAGIYTTPFTAWGNLNDPVAGTPYKVRDLVLKDAQGNPLPKLSGGWPLDPTHPGTLQKIDKQLTEFLNMGFDLVKLDFLTHGSLEGQHFDPKITTGTEAYNFGMKHISDFVSMNRIGRSVFLCLSIAPMFPNGYAQSRRISCDVFANIGATEYLMNSVTYGWWTHHRLYDFNDPDSSCIYQPLGEPPVTEAEARSRLTASVVTGGMLLGGDAMTKPEARDRVKRLFSNEEIMKLARRSIAFEPVNGDTGSKAGDLFEWADGKIAYVAAFNYDKVSTKTLSISLSRLGLKGTWQVHDLWSKADSSCSGSLAIKLAPMDCALLRLTRAAR